MGLLTAALPKLVTYDAHTDEDARRRREAHMPKAAGEEVPDAA